MTSPGTVCCGSARNAREPTPPESVSALFFAVGRENPRSASASAVGVGKRVVAERAGTRHSICRCR